MSKIIFYNMNGCGHCNRMKIKLDSYIKSGMVELVDAQQAGGKFDGFPAFEYNGKSAVGAMEVEALFAKLGVSGHQQQQQTRENYGCGGDPQPTPITESFGHSVSNGNYNNYARYGSQNRGYARVGDL